MGKESSIPIQKSSNPWDVSSIYDFNFFCCPECDKKSQSKQDFIDHASANHPQALEAFEKISDGSLSDVNIPNFNLDIKLEEEKINLPPVIENSHSNEENDEIKNENDNSDKEDEPLKKRAKR